MKPVTFDFDVVTDAPAPPRRAPEKAAKPLRPDAEERPNAKPPERDLRVKTQAAE